MQRKEIEQIFQAVCRAFPRSRVKILHQRGGVILESETIACPPREEVCTMHKEATVFMDGEHEYYRITLPLLPRYQLFLDLLAEDYPDAVVPVRMLEALISLVVPDDEETGAGRRAAQEGENPLLRSLFYADTREMKIYTVLLAEESGKSLEVPRVVCVLSGDLFRIQNVLDVISDFWETDEQDIFGAAGEDGIILCRRLVREDQSIRCQMSGYLGNLQRLLRDRCGCSPEIWVGTMAIKPEEYRRSLEAARAAGEFSQHRTGRGKIVYSGDYILEFTFRNTPAERLRHFLEPWMEPLRREPELVDAAEALLENNMNLSLAADQKFVHRNTMTTRVSRLREVLDIDPVHRDQDRFFLMLLCAYYRRFS